MRLTKRRWLWVLLGLAAVPAGVLFGKWREAGRRGGQQPAEPFRIAGNLYYVGANDVTSFLLTGPDGHVLIDGGYPRTAPMIMASIAKLGFEIKDVRVLLNTEPHFDHAGGLAELQKASGAEIWASEFNANAIESGGAGAGSALLNKITVWTRFARYTPARVHRRFQDGDTIRVGPIELTAHITAGHTRGCTSYSFPVRDGDRDPLVVHICSLSLIYPSRIVTYPGYEADFERTFRVLRSLPADIWVTTHARHFGRYRKFLERANAKDPVAPFIDRAGYLAYIDSAEKRFREELAGQRRRR